MDGKEVTLEYCNQLMEKYEAYKETAEQHEFPKLLMIDRLVVPAHKDLNANWDKGHGEIFVRGILNSIFPKLGISAT